MNNLLFQNATVFLDDRFLTGASVYVNNGRIQSISDQPIDAPDATVVDLSDDYLIPGLIDLQLYGGSQLFLNEIPTPDTVRHIFDTHNRNGTTTLLPTIHSTSLDVMQQAMDAVQVVRMENPLGVPGIHVEGPYFNPIKRGAHSAAFVRVPDEAELTTLFSRNADVIRILTLAPEMLPPERLQQLFDLKHPNTRLSLGHSNATYSQATAALNTGQVPLATHLYNAMRGYESREPGVVGAIFDHPTVCTSLVADGYHCNPATIRIAHRLLGDRLFLISDALFAAPPGVDGPRPTFTLGEFVVHYVAAPNGLSKSTPGQSTRGCYMNNEGKLAGSALTLIDCVRVCVEQAGLPLTDVLRKATSIPANAAGLGDQIGRIQAGYAARLVRLDKALNVQAVWQ
jgi:N-acetylglucosamine-6-phosphate deacetylase